MQKAKQNKSNTNNTNKKPTTKTTKQSMCKVANQGSNITFMLITKNKLIYMISPNLFHLSKKQMLDYSL